MFRAPVCRFVIEDNCKLSQELRVGRTVKNYGSTNIATISVGSGLPAD